MEVPSDGELIDAIAQGDEHALAELHARHHASLAARLRRHGGDPDQVNLAIEDTFEAVWRSAGRWNRLGEPAAWLWGIASRRLAGVRRKEAPWWRHRAADPVPEGLVMGAEEQVLLDVEHGELAVALASLTPEQLAVVQARVLDGLTTKQAASRLGIPAGTVKSRLSRALARLRGALS